MVEELLAPQPLVSMVCIKRQCLWGAVGQTWGKKILAIFLWLKFRGLIMSGSDGSLGPEL
jgi:hypothetical protein